VVLVDDRPGAPAANVFWAGNLEEVGMVLHGYQSAWFPVSLLQDDQQGKLVDSLFAAARHWEVVLHVNKGLAGGANEAIDAAKNTAMNPAVLDAFALIICAAAGPPAYPGIPDHEPDLLATHSHREAIEKAMKEIRKVLPSVGSYVAESDFFDVAGIVLGTELREVARREGQVRSRPPLLRASRGGQQPLERRRLHALGLIRGLANRWRR